MLLSFVSIWLTVAGLAIISCFVIRSYIKENKEKSDNVAKRLEISEDELMAFHELPKCTEKFKSQEKLYNIGIRLYEILGIEKRIRK